MDGFRIVAKDKGGLGLLPAAHLPKPEHVDSHAPPSRLDHVIAVRKADQLVYIG